MTTKEYVQYASGRPELCEKMSACTAPEEAYAIATSEGLTDDFDTFFEIVKSINTNTTELCDDDLDMVTAGDTTTGVIISCMSGSVAGFTLMAGACV